MAASACAEEIPALQPVFGAYGRDDTGFWTRRGVWAEFGLNNAPWGRQEGRQRPSPGVAARVLPVTARIRPTGLLGAVASIGLFLTASGSHRQADSQGGGELSAPSISPIVFANP